MKIRLIMPYAITINIAFITLLLFCCHGFSDEPCQQELPPLTVEHHQPKIPFDDNASTETDTRTRPRISLDVGSKKPLIATHFYFETNSVTTSIAIPEGSVAELLLRQFPDLKIEDLKKQLRLELQRSYQYQLEQLGALTADFDHFEGDWLSFVKASLFRLAEEQQQALATQQRAVYEVLSYREKRDSYSSTGHGPVLPHPDDDPFYHYPLITLFEKVLELFTTSPYRTASASDVIYSLMKHSLEHPMGLSAHVVCNVLFRQVDGDHKKAPYHGETSSNRKHFKKSEKQVRALISHESREKKVITPPEPVYARVASGIDSLTKNARSLLKPALLFSLPNEGLSSPVRPHECQPNEFKCTSKDECVLRTHVCDNISHCKDASDETPQACKEQCGDTRFSCKKIPQCIDKDRECDTYYDCLDGSDEAACATCPKEMVQCLDKSACITDEQFCDARTDCTDGSDETPSVCEERFVQQADALEYCPKNTPRPRCLEESKRVLCDDEDIPTTEQIMQRHGLEKKLCEQLKDKSNYGEQACCRWARDGDGDTAYESKHTQQCIDTNKVCDGQDNGIDGQLDESPELCNDPRLGRTNDDDCYMRCDGTGACVPKKKMCNGAKECRDGEDEMTPHCFSHDDSVRFNQACGSDPTAFACGDNHCVGKDLMCDGHQDCPNGADEISMHCTRHNIDMHLHQACGNEPTANTTACHDRVRQDACNALPDKPMTLPGISAPTTTPTQHHSTEEHTTTQTAEPTTTQSDQTDTPSTTKRATHRPAFKTASKTTATPSITQPNMTLSTPSEQYPLPTHGKISQQKNNSGGITNWAAGGTGALIGAVVVGAPVFIAAVCIGRYRFNDAFICFKLHKLGTNIKDHHSQEMKDLSEVDTQGSTTQLLFETQKQ